SCATAAPPAGGTTIRRYEANRERLTRRGITVCAWLRRSEWPREESNLRTQIRSLPLYPLSYGAGFVRVAPWKLRLPRAPGSKAGRGRGLPQTQAWWPRCT